MIRKHGKQVKQNNTTRAKFQRDVTANKKALTKILKDMTLTIRNNMAEAAKSKKNAKKNAKEADKAVKESKKEADKADKEQAKKANKKAQEQRKFDAAVKKFSIELKTAARKEAKADKKESKEAKKQAKMVESDMRAARQQDAKEKLDALSVKADFIFIPFVGWVSE
jgi:chromatin assembly factor 1 subunit A